MHTYTKKIYYHDTDCGGVVYYANYLKFLEEARTEYMADRGIDLDSLSKEGIWFVVKTVTIDYKAPAHYNDTLSVTTELVKMKNVSLEFVQHIRRGDTLLVATRTVLVCVSGGEGAFSAAVIPEDVRKALTGDV